MKRLLSLLFVITTLSVTSQAQTILHSRPTVDPALITNPVVQKELTVSEEQKTKLTDLSKRTQQEHIEINGGSQEEIEAQLKDYSEKFDKLVWDGLAKVLDEKQLKRFKQINRQSQGIRALASKDSKTALALTDDQDKQIQTLLGSYDNEEGEMMSTMTQVDAGNQEFKIDAEGSKKLKALGVKYYEKALAILTADQKVKWDELVGAKVDLGV